MRLVLAFLCLLLGIGFYLLTGWYPDVAWLQGAVIRIGFPSVLAAACLVLILWPARPSGGDPLARSWMAVSLMGCLLISVLILGREGQLEADRLAEDRLRESANALRLEQIRQQQLKREEVADRRERAKTDRFVQYEGRIPDDTLQQLRELDERMQGEVKTQADAYALAMEQNPTHGPDDWVHFRTLDQLEMERTAHQALYEQTRNFTQFIESFEERYEQEIEELQLQPPADRIAIAELQRILQHWEQTRVYDMRKLDVEFLANALRILDLLREAWGHWSYSPRDKIVHFENPDQELRFSEAVLNLKAILAELDVIEDKIDPESARE